MMTLIFPVVTSTGFYEKAGFLVFMSSDTLNLQSKCLIHEGKERKEPLSQGSKTKTDCEMPSMVRYEICGSEELSLFLKSCELVTLLAPYIA